MVNTFTMKIVTFRAMMLLHNKDTRYEYPEIQKCFEATKENIEKYRLKHETLRNEILWESDMYIRRERSLKDLVRKLHDDGLDEKKIMKRLAQMRYDVKKQRGYIRQLLSRLNRDLRI